MLAIIKFIVVLITSVVVMGASVLYGFSGFFTPDNMDEMLIPDAASQFYDRNGNVIYTTMSEERRLPIPLDQIPKYTQQAFIAIEDNRFYEHGGIDYRGTLRALVSTLSGQEVQGGSTITQQLAKNAFLTQERSIGRKIKEAFIARDLEEKYTKDEIIAMYLNRIYFGQGAYGIESASMYYFGKHAKDLTLAESAILAAIPKSPNYYNPFENPKESKERQELVLDQMAKYGFISEADADKAKAEKLTYSKSSSQNSSPRSYFFDTIIQKVIDELGADALYKGGLKIYTSIDMDMQRAAEACLQYLPDYYTDSEGLTQPQMALVAVDPHTGFVRAMIGGRGQDKFNRATMAVRQPGSSFKPFVYLTAMQNGLTPASIIEDKEEEFAPGWKPQNSDRRWHGKVTLRTALAYSINVPAIKVAREAGVDNIVDLAEKMGISTLVSSGKYSDANLAMALGGLSKGVNPVEMAAAYAVLASNGIYHKPISVMKILDRDGKVLYEQEPISKRVVDAGAAYMTVSMMEDVLKIGTGRGMGIGRPAAGKTGTTDTYVDAWFVGFTPDLCTAVWVGDDSNRPMDRMYGSNEPLTIWHNFMENALASTPASDFINPGVTVPKEPVILQDDPKKNDDKDTKKEEDKKEEQPEAADKDTDKNKNKDKNVKKDKNDDKVNVKKDKEQEKTKEKTKKETKSEKAKSSSSGSTPSDSSSKSNRSTVKERVQEVTGDKPSVSNKPKSNEKPVVSNKPTPSK